MYATMDCPDGQAIAGNPAAPTAPRALKLHLTGSRSHLPQGARITFIIFIGLFMAVAILPALRGQTLVTGFALGTMALLVGALEWHRRKRHATSLLARDDEWSLRRAPRPDVAEWPEAGTHFIAEDATPARLRLLLTRHGGFVEIGTDLSLEEKRAVVPLIARELAAAQRSGTSLSLSSLGDLLMIRALSAAAVLGSTALLAACNAEAPTTTEPAASSASADSAASAIAITAPWSRETAGGQNAGGAFMAIANTGTAADRLIGGSSPVAGRVEIHTMSVDDGVMRMRQLGDGLEVPAGGEVTLKPGGFHVMLMDLKQPLKVGDKVPLTLTFEGAGPFETELEVQPASAAGPAMQPEEGEKPHG